MKEINMQKLSLFPTDIWLGKLSLSADYKKQLTQDLYTKKKTLRLPERSNRGSWQTHKLLHQEQLYKPLCQQFTQIILPIFTKAAECSFAQLWAQISKKGDWNELHQHGGYYDLSGAFYLTVPPNSGVLYFRDPRPGAMMCPSQPFHSGWYYNVEVKDDDLLLFYPFLEHGAHAGTQTEDRIMFSFDINLIKKEGAQGIINPHYTK
tara:strand:- start:206 stop:823 length:618 start_codon:yes stop_codon:yes gene_type:complete